MAGGGSDSGDVSLSDAPLYRVELLFFAIIIITLLWEKGTDALDEWLSNKQRKGLKKAIHKLQEEILVLGLISLILIVFEKYILKLCIKKEDDEYEDDEYEKDYKHLLFRKILAASGHSCPEGKEPFWSSTTIHDLHIFIFLLAVVHILYAAISIYFCLWRLRRWTRWEKGDHILTDVNAKRLIFAKSNFMYSFSCFWAQFTQSIDGDLYLSLRRLFIERLELDEDYDFHTFMLNSMEDEFSRLVKLDWLMWLLAALWIAFPFLVIVAWALATVILLIIGAKLELVAVKLCQLAYMAYGNRPYGVFQNIKEANIIKTSMQLFRRSATPGGSSPKPNLKTSSLAPPKIIDEKETLAKRADSWTDMNSFKASESEKINNNNRNSPPSDLENQNPSNSNNHEPIKIRPKIRSINTKITDIDDKKEIETNLTTTPNTTICKKPRLIKSLFKSKCHSSFSKNYHLTDSANLFWFKRPRLIIKATQYIYFETSMLIAVFAFNAWNDSEIINLSQYFGTDHLYSTILFLVISFLTMLHTSFMVLPTYALTMAAGSHCPESILKKAKKKSTNPEYARELKRLSSKEGKEEKTPLHWSEIDQFRNSRIGESSTIDTNLGSMYTKERNKKTLDNRAGKTSFMFQNTTSNRHSIDVESYDTVSSVSTPRFGENNNNKQDHIGINEHVFNDIQDEKLTTLIENTTEIEDSENK